MRHRKAGRKLNRSGAHRRAMLRNMVTSLLRHERIQTTDAKAKEVRSHAEKIITLGKRGTLHARRQALTFVRDRAVVRKVFDDLAQRFRDRPGGYTRIVKLGIRPGDAAPMAVVELTDRGDEARSEAERKRERKRRAAARKAEPGGAAAPGTP